ncbi:hypothetical protein ABEY50_08210 [Priestia megaterium]
MNVAIIIKAEEKFLDVISKLPESYTDDEFVEKFKELYAKDWDKVARRYQNHERQNQNKKKKSHPMPEPKKYVLNISHKLRKK